MGKWIQSICRLEKEKGKQARESYKSNHKQTKMDSFLKASKGVVPPTAKMGQLPDSSSPHQVGSPVYPEATAGCESSAIEFLLCPLRNGIVGWVSN